ncbi:MAG: DUF1571 domain-containing protein [Pirellulaceae bacterium]
MSPTTPTPPGSSTDAVATPPDVRGDDLKPTGPASESSPPPRRGRRRGLIALLVVVAVCGAAAWGAYRIVAPPPGPEGPSDVQITHGGDGEGDSQADGDAASGGNVVPGDAPEHPLDPALDIARDGLKHIRADVKDYTAKLVKRERIKGELTAEETMFLKVRNRKMEGDKLVTPLSVYMRFLKPESKEGREVIWVENQNDGNLVAHDAGLAKFIRAKLPPTGFLAMLGNRYPITEIGIENLVLKLIERGEKEKKVGLCEVTFKEGEKINGRECTLIEIRHPEPNPKYEFFIGQIFIDKKHFVPVRYAAYKWPEEEGGENMLEEEYTYLDLKLNVGLTDKDFDPDNPAYEFP